MSSIPNLYAAILIEYPAGKLKLRSPLPKNFSSSSSCTHRSLVGGDYAVVNHYSRAKITKT